jgi:hypothetical protein
MLYRDDNRLKRLWRVQIEGGLPPSVTLISDLIEFLNKTATRPGKKIVMILERMLEIEEMTRPIMPEEPMIVAVEWEKTDPNKYKLHWEIEKRRALLERELSRYRFTPRAEVAMGGGGKGPSVWAAWWKGNDSRREEGLRFVAPEALELILKLTQTGDLTRLRQCNQCQKWLFARFRHQTFCSTQCQQRNYTQSDTWKAHRRAYMRRYYQKNFSQAIRTERARRLLRAADKP